MKKSIFYFSLLGLFLTISTKAQEKVEKLEEVVITATKFSKKKEHLGKIVYKITAKELKAAKGKTVPQVLETISSIVINGANSSATKNKDIKIRGGAAKQVLILIDGVPVGDPTGSSNSFDLRLLNLNQVESIEVMNGAASTLYGSGAATGVINITLKKAAKKAFAVNYRAALGTSNSQKNTKNSFLDLNQSLAINGTLNKFSYLISGGLIKDNGLSEASDEKSDTAFEKDTYNSANAFARLGYKFSTKFNVNLFANFDEVTSNYDGGAFRDSDVNVGRYKQQKIGLNSNYKYNNGELKAVASYFINNRVYESYSSWTKKMSTSKYEGKTFYADVVNNYKINSDFSLITGLAYTNQKNESANVDAKVAKLDIVEPYVTLLYNSSAGLNISAGARLNNHSEYGSHWVYNVNPSFNINKNIKLLASYSTAFIAPSTFQLFSGKYGNKNLKPEESYTVEGGFAYTRKGYELNSVFFYRNEDTAIIYDFATSKYGNAEKLVQTKGIETELKINAIDKVALRLAHTYTYNNILGTNYIPKNKFSAAIETTLLDRTFLSLQFKSHSSRKYVAWGAKTPMKLDQYGLVDFYGSYQLIKNRLSVFGQVTNILNEDYIEVYGYTTKGRNFKVGFNFTF